VTISIGPSGRSRPFMQVDVFTDAPYYGNPVGVVLDGGGLSDEQMLRITRWANLSETTFVVAPTEAGADYRVRIFSPAGELPFAGHPTLGTAHAWMAHTDSDQGSVVQECGVGLVEVRRAPYGLAFAAPPVTRSGAVDSALVDHIAATLNLDRALVVGSQWVDNGPGWVAVMLQDAAAVLDLRPGLVDLNVGVVGFYPEGSELVYEVRAFFPKDGATTEDPVTGSLNASLAQWLTGTGRLTAPYVAGQGTALGRRGRVHVDRDEDGAIWVGGGTLTCIVGEVWA
jgi:PhzF family phenazine biosynthesis protein